MESMKTHLVVWLSGLLAGLILMERWRRLGDPEPTAEGASDVADTTTGAASADKPKGMKADRRRTTAEAGRARQALSQVVPWATNTASSLAGTASPSRTDSTEAFEDSHGSRPQS